MFMPEQEDNEERVEVKPFSMVTFPSMKLPPVDMEMNRKAREFVDDLRDWVKDPYERFLLCEEDKEIIEYLRELVAREAYRPTLEVILKSNPSLKEVSEDMVMRFKVTKGDT